MNARPTYLIIPAAGQSRRYGLDKPKFLLQHPTGVTMLERSILGLGGLGRDCGLSKIVIVSTATHFEEINLETLKMALKNASGLDVEFHFLEKPTSSVVETLTFYFASLDEDVSVVIKDSDNLVQVDLGKFLGHENVLGYADLSDFPNVSAPSKSFLEIGAAGMVTNFVEKRVISSTFSVGLTKFARISDVMDAAQFLITSKGELYVSDLVRAMTNNGIDFQAVEVLNYEDWGTLSDWIAYTRSYKTIFIDLDGVVSINSGRLSSLNDWSSLKPIEQNVEYLLELQSSGRVQFVFTTSRDESYRSEIIAQLQGLKLENPTLIMGLHHSQKLLVSEFTATKPYPSASAVSISPNSTNLREYLSGFFD